MIVHLYTSSKGGVGKTLCALSTAVKYLENSDKVLCIDLNWENADLARIIRLGEPIRRGNRFAFSSISGGNGLVLRPAVPYTIASAAIGFWESLREALEESDQEHSFTPTVVIVDTGLHFANLIRRTSSGTAELVLERINLIAKDCKVSKLHIWFIWTLAAMYGREHKPHIQAVLNLFRDGFQGHFFHPESNFINVINPYALYPLASILKAAKDGLKGLMNKDWAPSESLQHLKRLAEAPVRRGIAFDELVTEILDRVISTVGKRPTDTLGFLELLALQLLHEYEQRRPRNVFPIPVYDSRVVGFTDVFAREDPTRIEDLVDEIAPVSLHIGRYIEDL